MIRVSRMVTAGMAVLALAAGSPGVAQALPSADSPPSTRGSTADGPSGSAAERLPDGWRISGSGEGRQLVWVSPVPVPMGDARVEFHSGSALLGRPLADDDRHTFRLPLDGVDIGPARELKVLAGGRRLDEAGAAAAKGPRSSAPPAEQPAPPKANGVDPGVPGSFRTVSGEYELDPVKLPGFPEPVEMRATVTGPVGATGRRPLALFLHGRHFTCYDAKGEALGGWPCPANSKAVPSHRGYLHDQKLLASQGYVTVSVSANGINGQDYNAEDGGAQARSSLVRQHLARWAEWSADPAKAPAAVRAASRADLSRVLLVGHSRGGEGVNRAALDTLSRPPADQEGYKGPVRWRIRGTVLIGPTIFGQNPVPDVPSMTILPGCDGDVSDLQGQIYLDGTRGVSRGTALHSAVYMVGANHNFFNTEWTPGQAEAPADDDFWTEDTPDAVCSPGTKTRLTAKQQQKAGSTYIAAAARLFVAGDDRVRPLLDGSDRRAPSAGPARVLSHAVGGNRRPAFVPDSSVTVTGSGGRLCAQVDSESADACLPSDVRGASPHFAVWETSSEPGRHAVRMKWSKPGSPVRVRPARPVSLRGDSSLALRLIVPPNTSGTQLDVTLVDASGRRAKLGQAKVDGLPGTGRTASHWAREVRLPMSAATRAKLDLRRITTLELTPRGRAGQAWLMDAWNWRPGTPVTHPAPLARVDIGRTEVAEGDSGVRTHRIPIRVSGKGNGQVRLFLPDPNSGKISSRLVTLSPGNREIVAQVKVKGDKRYSYGTQHNAFVKAVQGTAVGTHLGGLTVKEDDPMPKVTVTPVADKVVEGKPLTWRVSLSEAAGTEIVTGFDILPPAGGPELSSLDVSPAWLEEVFGVSANPERPLSSLVDTAYLHAVVPAGKLSTEVTVPTVKDAVAEPEERLRLRSVLYDESWEPREGPEFTGTVRNAP
ncbi:hypothetical protein GCM10010232_16020 [Streptomyces amakusaensis]|uniref:Secreted protein n=1 Tax=Streptomyces amakusaensis TaxID=67271 RepID=A0ABW0AH73_9ACTN